MATPQQPGAAFVATAKRCGGAQFFHRFNRTAAWEAYTEDQNAQILRAMAETPDKGVMPIQLAPGVVFEIRWGMGGEFGIQQRNTRSGNTRDVKAEVRGTPRGPARAPSFIESGFASRKEYEAALSEGLAGALDLSEGEVDAYTVAHAHWFWQEDAYNISKHSASDVQQPGNWVRYAGSVCAELDKNYHAYVSAGKTSGLEVVEIDLTDRIGSTGTEQKANNQHTGLGYLVDFNKMEQKNAKSGFSRKMLREEFQASKPIPKAPPPAPAAPPAPAGTNVQVNVTVAAPQMPQMPMGVPVDLDGDGIPDVIGYDTTGDGQINTMAPLSLSGMRGGMPPMGGMPQPMGGMPMPQPMGGPPMPQPVGPVMGGPPMPQPMGGPPQQFKAQVPPNHKGGDQMQVNTPKGVMTVTIPDGLVPGNEFEFMA